MTDIDEQLDKIEEKQSNMKHEAMLYDDVEYAMDMFLPQVIDQLEGVSRELSKYGHEYCVPQLIHKLKDY